MKLKKKNEIFDFLLKIGNGEYSFDNETLIDLTFLITFDSDIVSEIYDTNLPSSSQSSVDLSTTTIFAPKNENCDKMNKVVLDLLPEMSRFYTSYEYTERVIR